MALKDPEAGELEAMQEEFGLHELAVEDAAHGHQRPKVDEYGDSVFAVLHIIEIVDGQLQVGEVDIFAGPNYILSVSSRAEKGFREVRARCEREPELLKLGSGFVLYALMDAVVDRYFPVIDALETELEKLEASMFGGGSVRTNIEENVELAAEAHGLETCRRSVLRGCRQARGWSRAASLLRHTGYYRDVSDHLSRINQSIDALTRNGDDGAFSQPVVDHIAGERNHEAPRVVRRADCRAHHDSGNLRHELPAYAGARLAIRVSVAIAIMLIIDAYLYTRFRSAGWL